MQGGFSPPPDADWAVLNLKDIATKRQERSSAAKNLWVPMFAHGCLHLNLPSALVSPGLPPPSLSSRCRQELSGAVKERGAVISGAEGDGNWKGTRGIASPNAVARVSLCVLWVGCQLSLLGGEKAYRHNTVR